MSVPPTQDKERADLAAEYALGVLEGGDLRAARTRLIDDPQFRNEVAEWHGKLAPLLDEIEPIEAPARLWSAIESRLGPISAPREQGPADNVVQLRRRVGIWRGVAAGAAALAASLALVVVTRPAQVAAPPARQAPAPAPMVAMLADDERGGLMVAKWEPGSRRMTVAAPKQIELEPGQVQELWVIQADGKPRSLGVLPNTSRNELQLLPAVAQQLQEGATLAVSVEPQGGSPTGLPTGPVIASGKLGLV